MSSGRSRACARRPPGRRTGRCPDRRAAAAGDQSYPVPAPARVTLKGHGFGHGHGMSQYGAEGAARQGKT